MRGAPLAATLIALLLAVAPAARAESAADKAAAEALFDQAKALMAEGKHAAACPKLEESLRLDAGIGTMLWLAECYEKNGQTASAWAEFREAAAAAGKKGDPRASIAKGRAALLEPILPKLAISVPEAANVSGLEVARDGTPIGRALWGTPLPCDPGEHAIVARAPGMRPWRTSVKVPASAAAVTVTIGPLDPEPRARDAIASDGSAAPAPQARGGTRVIGLAVAGLGLVALGAGGFLAVTAKSDLDASNADGHCRADNHCDAAGYQSRIDAQHAANAATVAFAVGGAALAGGVALVLFAPKSDASRAPSVAIGAGSVSLRASF